MKNWSISVKFNLAVILLFAISVIFFSTDEEKTTTIFDEVDYTLSSYRCSSDSSVDALYDLEYAIEEMAEISYDDSRLACMEDNR